MSAPWIRDSFEIAYLFGPRKVRGKSYRGLGLHLLSKAYRSPKGRRFLPARWSLSHLGSGHCLVTLTGEWDEILPVATEIAEAGDWDFLSMQGWRDRFPDAPERLAELVEKHASMCKRGQSRGNMPEIAQQIAANRP